MVLSVIVPNYNHGALIARSLGALAAQTPAGSEIIVVDDGSTDDSVKVIETVRARYPAIRLVRHDRNRGVLAAVYTGIEAAAGDYLFFASADDFVFPNLLSRAVQALDKNPDAAFFCASAAVFNEQDKVIGFRPVMVPRTTAGYISPADARRIFRDADNFIIGTGVVHRRKCLASIGYFDESLGSLCDGMAYRLMALRYGFYFDPEVLASFQVSLGSYSTQSSLSVVDSGKTVDTATRWIRENFPEDMRNPYALLFARRLRFNLGRHQMVWRTKKLETDTMAKIMNLTPLDSVMLKILGTIPFASSTFVLAWIYIRMRPYSLWAIVKGAWFNFKHNRPRAAEIEQSIVLARVPQQ